MNNPERDITPNQSVSLPSRPLIERHSGTVPVHANPKVLPPRPSGVGPKAPGSASANLAPPTTEGQFTGPTSDPTKAYAPDEFAQLLRTSLELAKRQAKAGAVTGADPNCALAIHESETVRPPGIQGAQVNGGAPLVTKGASAAHGMQAPTAEVEELLVASMPPPGVAHEPEAGGSWDSDPWGDDPQDHPPWSTKDGGEAVQASENAAATAQRAVTPSDPGDSDGDVTSPRVRRPQTILLDDALQLRANHAQRRWVRNALGLLWVTCLAGVGFIAFDSRAQVAVLAQRLSNIEATKAAHAIPSDTGQSAVGAPRRPVRLDIEVLPAEARLFLDDELTSNPLRLTYPIDDLPHEIRAEAPGYETRSVTVRFDRDVLVMLALAPEP